MKRHDFTRRRTTSKRAINSATGAELEAIKRNFLARVAATCAHANVPPAACCRTTAKVSSPELAAVTNPPTAGELETAKSDPSLKALLIVDEEEQEEEGGELEITHIVVSPAPQPQPGAAASAALSSSDVAAAAASSSSAASSALSSPSSDDDDDSKLLVTGLRSVSLNPFADAAAAAADESDKAASEEDGGEDDELVVM